MALSRSQSNITIGDRRNKQQALVGIPAGPDGEDPGCLVLEGVDATASTYNRLYVWAASDNTLHYSTTEPSDEDADGTSLDGTLIAGAATKALDNISGVAINTDLISDTDSTDDVGSSSIYWANGFFDKVLFNSTATMDGASAGVVTLVGNLTGGVSGTGSAFQFFATTAGGYLKWDDTANSNAGGLIFTDDAQAIFGDASDFTMQWNATSMLMDNKTANTGNLVIGSAVATDVEFHGTTAGSDLIWDSSADDLIAYDDVHIAFGDGSDIYLNFDATDLEMRQATPGTGGFKIGVDDAGIDMTIYGDTANYGITWDASADAWTYLDSTVMAFGTADDITFSYDGTSNELDILGSGKKILFGVDDTGIDVKFFGATAGDYMLWDETNDKLLFEDATIAIAGANVEYSIGISTDELLITGTDHANNSVTFGNASQTNSTNVILQTATAGDNITFDAGAKTLTFTDATISLDYDNGTETYNISNNASDQLVIDALDDTAAGKLLLGTSGTNGLDVEFQSITAGDTITFDAGAKTLTFTDVSISLDYDNGTETYNISNNSSDQLIIDALDDTSAGMLLLGTAGTNGLDVTFQSITGGDTIVFDAGAKTFSFVDVNLVIGAEYIQFFDSAIKISSIDGQLDIDADVEVEIATALVDLNGNLDVSGTLTQTGDATFLGGANCITGGADGATQGAMTLWDGAGGNTPAYILLHSPNGTARYFFVEDDGTLKYHTAAPTANADGSAVGDQTD